jgi:hypothetical protein
VVAFLYREESKGGRTVEHWWVGTTGMDASLKLIGISIGVAIRD